MENLKKMGKLFGKCAVIVLSWPNGNVETKVGAKRLGGLPESLRPVAADFYSLVMRHRWAKSYEPPQKNNTLRRVAYAENGKIKLGRLAYEHETQKDLTRYFREARQTALKQSLEKEIPFELLGKRALQNLAHKNGILLKVKEKWNGYGYKVVSRSVGAEDCQRWAVIYQEYMQSQKRKNYVKAKKRTQEKAKEKENELDDMAFDLGVLRDSRAFAWYLSGDISEEECRRIGEKTRRRHERTNYDALLSAGYSKDDARVLAEEI